MKFAVIGGDARAGGLAALLAGDGHTVRSFALEKAALPQRVSPCSSLDACVYGADWVLVGIPAEKNGELLTPLSVQHIAVEELLTALWPGQTLCGGRFDQATSLAAVRAGLSVCDLMTRRDFTVGNAALTAEGAVGLLIRESPGSLWKGRALVTGWGRIASQLGPRLRALGCEVRVAARKAGDRAEAEGLGLRACTLREIPDMAGELDFLINTVPAQILSKETLEGMRPDSVLLELASEPGFDRTLAEELNLRAVYAPGLPGRSAPCAAARLMRDTVYAVMREREEREENNGR
jgi:Lactate dehydrogenase and related dehydrogenases